MSCLAIVVLGVSAAEVDSTKLPPIVPVKIDFRRDIYPLLEGRCFKCHQGRDAASGYRLDLRAELLGETGGEPLVQIGKSGQSKLVHMITGAVPGKRMPPKGERLTPEQIARFRAWIDQGLAWDDSLLPPDTAGSTHWAFRTPTRPAVSVQARPPGGRAWVRNPIDAFVAAKHEEKGLIPAAEADRRTLIRRLYLDLLGLPPAPEDIDLFLADTSPDAYEKLVDRLLASPHYGERWARHWLDLARWAETEGYESNHPRPYAWRYRDYVVKCFNEDRPFDRFIREQLAGDEIEPYSDENLIATGFLAAARLSSNEEDKALQRNDILVDVVNATSSSLLGLTLNCAQCHNHKFDPLSQRDYYRFQGFFVKGQPGNLALKDAEQWAAYERAKPPEYDPAKKLQQALLDAAKERLIAEARKSLTPEQLKAVDTPPEKRTPEQEKLARAADLKFQFTPNRIEKAILADDQKLYDELKKKIEALEKKMPDKPQTFGFYSPATSSTKVDVLPMKGFYPLPYVPAELAQAKPHLLGGGDVHRRGPELDAGWPALFGPLTLPSPPQRGRGEGEGVPAGSTAKKSRTALADWITDPTNPLTYRVYVNRLWQWHFGRGLVATPSDFGVKGAVPTHPELLDWLATEFVRSGMSTKHIHRLIVTSSTYRQASIFHPANAKLDPDNTLWWRWSPRRLEAEAIRDSLLTVSGELDQTAGGPSVASDDGKQPRRSLYLTQKRQGPLPIFPLFDAPPASESCARRYVSTTAHQPLFMLNNEWSLNRAKRFAERVRATAGEDRARQIERAFVLALGRAPDEVEWSAARKFFESQHASEGPAALVSFCQAVLNLNQFVYTE